MLTQVCAYLKNYFIKDEKCIHAGKFSINNGSILLPFLVEGQFFRIVGSVLNDGVHRYPASDLQDEVFEGSVWSMAVPPAVVDLTDQIESWCEANRDAIDSPYTSESFGGYSYNKRGSNRQNDTGVLTWQSQFASQLYPYKRLFVI